MKTLEIEIAIMREFDIRRNLIVPNITTMSGLVPFEVDMLVLSKRGYATGVEIKVSRGDLKADLKKRQWARLDFPKMKDHYFGRFKYFNYAVPAKLKEAALEQIPEWCGLYVADTVYERTRLHLVRQPERLYNKKWSDLEMYEVARLGAMRIYGLKITHLAAQL